MSTATKLLSYEEWLELPADDEGREECVNGVVEKMPAAKWNHTVVVERLTRQLWKQLDEKTMVVSSNFGLIVRRNPLTQRTPDIAVFSLANLIERDGYIHSVPELAVEVLSTPNSRARIHEKLADYASIGLPETWVVDPVERTVAIHRELPHDGVTTLLRFPSVTVDFAAIWP
jgi:Uma2 family endonuclease